MPPRRDTIQAHHFQCSEVGMRIDDAADVADLGRARHHLLGDFARPIDLAQRPERQGQIGHYGNADILGETNDEIGIPFRIKHGERAFELSARHRRNSRQANWRCR